MSPLAQQPEPSKPVLPKRYRLEEFLGQGVSKSVWRAFDSLLRRDVAIAAFTHPNPADGESTAAILDEARHMASISDAPQIVTIYDVLSSNNRLLYCIRLMRGGDLAHYSLANELSWPERSRIPAQIVDGLRSIHQAGVVHGDVKPKNILLDEHHSAYIADFGLSKIIDHSVTPSTALRGTPKYMAPELFRKAPPTVRSDVYSLGCVLYEVLTGVAVAPGSSLREVVDAHIRRVPVSVADINPQVPKAVSEFIDTLLAKDPIARPVDLSIGAALLNRLAVQDNPVNPRLPRPSPIAFGRERQIQKIKEAITQSSIGSSRVLVLTGDPGIGKTLLLRKSIETLHEQQFLVCSSSATELLRRPLGCIKDAVAPHLASLSLFANNPHFAATCNSDETNPRDLHGILLRAIRSYARHNRIALILDDLHWADQQTRIFTRDLLDISRSEAQHLFVLASTRWSAEYKETRHWVGDLLQAEKTRRIHLEGLTERNVAMLAQAQNNSNLSEENLAALMTASAGNPLYVTQSLVVGPRQSPMPLQDLLNERLNMLSEEAHNLLRHLALLHPAVELQTLAALLQQSNEHQWDLLGESEDAGVIQLGASGVEFQHPLFRTVLRLGWGEINARRVHASLASLLQAKAQESDSKLLIFMHHAWSARRFFPSEQLANYADRAASAAFRNGQWSLTREYAGLALAHISTHPNGTLTSGELHLLIARAAKNLNDLDQADREFQLAEQQFADDREFDGLVEASYHRLTTQSHRTSGAVSTESLERLIAQLPAHERAARLRATLALADVRLDQLQPADSQHLLAQIDAQDIAKADPLQSTLLHNIAAGALEQTFEFDAALRAYWSGHDSARQAVNTERMNESVCQMPRTRLFAGDFLACNEFTVYSRELFDRSRNQRHLLRALCPSLSVAIVRGAFEEAQELYEEALFLLKRTGFDQLAGDVYFAGCQLASYTGEERDANSALLPFQATGSVRNSGPFQSISMLYGSHVRQLFGEHRECVDLRQPKCIQQGRIDPYRINRVCLNALLANPGTCKELIVECLHWLDVAESAGQLWTSSWSFLLPHVRARAHLRLGQTTLAVSALSTAQDIAKGCGALAELRQIDATFAELTTVSSG